MTINGNNKTINGDKYQFLYIFSGASVTINNLTITNCQEEEGGAIDNTGILTINNSNLTNNNADYGGAIHNNYGGTININNSNLTNNNANGWGGAIYNEEGTLNITNSNLTNNKANVGGAIHNYGTLNINNSNLTNNNATRGGAIDNNRYGTLSITGSNLTNNKANVGGAIDNTGTLNITGSNLTNNNANSGGAIDNEGTLTINNSNLTNNNANGWGGAIYNEGTLNINNSNLTNNNANVGGAIYNYGTLNINNSNLTNNNANNGGAIQNNYGGTININNSNLTNNNANGWGGAIYNNEGTLSITNSNLTNNNATHGGAICDYTDPDNINEIIVFNSNFIENTAENGAVIYNHGGYGTYTITNNLLQKNTATNDKETHTLGENSAKTVKENTYDSTDIKLKTINLTKEDKSNYTYGEDIILNFTIELEHPEYYDSDILEKLDKTIYINDKENDTTKKTNHTLSQLKLNNYTVYYTTCNTNSNNVTFTVTANSQITTEKTSYEYYEGIKDNITLNITDASEEKGTIDLYVKEEEDQYTKILSYPNIKNGSNIPIETIIESLKNIYDPLEDSYNITMNYTSNNKYVSPNSTEITLNIIKQRNTTISYNIVNQTENNVQINITVLDKIYNTPISEAQIKITGDINQNTTSGIITDTTLTAGDYTITVNYDGTDDYNPSNTTIDFTVEIDKDAKITELEETINNLTEQLKEAKDEITTLNDTNNNLSKKNEQNTKKLYTNKSV